MEEISVPQIVSVEGLAWYNSLFMSPHSAEHVPSSGHSVDNAHTHSVPVVMG